MHKDSGEDTSDRGDTGVLDAVSHRLAEIQDALLQLPEGPSPERFELLTEQDKLRAQARQFHAASVGAVAAERSSVASWSSSWVRKRGRKMSGVGVASWQPPSLWEHAARLRGSFGGQRAACKQASSSEVWPWRRAAAPPRRALSARRAA